MRLEKYMRFREAFKIAKQERPEVTEIVVRRAILAKNGDSIPSRRSSRNKRSWIYVRPCDILSFYEKMEKR